MKAMGPVTEILREPGHPPSVARDHCARCFEVAQEELPHVFRISVLRERGKANEVYKYHRADSALSGSTRRSGSRQE